MKLHDYKTFIHHETGRRCLRGELYVCEGDVREYFLPPDPEATRAIVDYCLAVKHVSDNH
jgi:hypothetical protein